MDNQIQEMQDRQEIIDLTMLSMVAGSWAKRALRYRFTEDAVCDYMTVIVEGLPAIVEKVTNALGPLDASQHIISNQQVTIDGDTATCRCYLHAQHTLRGTEGGDNFIIAGRYDDELVRTPDGWRINSGN